jgi:hypothetical protein
LKVADSQFHNRGESRGEGDRVVLASSTSVSHVIMRRHHHCFQSV